MNASTVLLMTPRSTIACATCGRTIASPFACARTCSNVTGTPSAVQLLDHAFRAPFAVVEDRRELLDKPRVRRIHEVAEHVDRAALPDGRDLAAVVHGEPNRLAGLAGGTDACRRVVVGQGDRVEPGLARDPRHLGGREGTVGVVRMDVKVDAHQEVNALTPVRCRPSRSFCTWLVPS